MASAGGVAPCFKCKNKYNRHRSSLCECKHCLKSFCIDCIREHTDELSHESNPTTDFENETRDLLNQKQHWIDDEINKSKEQIDRWLEKYIQNLKLETEILNKRLNDVGKEAHAKLKAWEDELQELMRDHNLIRNRRAKLNDLNQRLFGINVQRVYDLPSAIPKYDMKFSFTSAAKENQPHTEEEKTESDDDVESEDSEFEENYFCNRPKFEKTGFIVDCMASDGLDIMYFTTADRRYNRIAYCYLNRDDPEYGQADTYRNWFQSPIVDMIWWVNVEKFLCATEKGMYSVEFNNDNFRILLVINHHWTEPRIASNTDALWIYESEKILIYNNRYELLRTVIPDFLTTSKVTSFALTDDHVAFVLTRTSKKNHEICEMRLYNLTMNLIRIVQLGAYDSSPMIRTDDIDRFFIAVGRQQFYIVSTNGFKEIVNLGKQASCLAVVNKFSVALTKSRDDLELVHCQE